MAQSFNLFAIILCLGIVKGFKVPDNSPFQKVRDVGVYYTPLSRNANCGNIRLPFGCGVSVDCATINCKCPFGGQLFEVELKVNECETPVSMTGRVKVPLLNIDFSHTFKTTQRIVVPGIGQNLGVIEGGVFVNTAMRSGTTHVRLVVSLQTGIVVAGNPLVPIKLDLLNGDLPISTANCNEGQGGSAGPGPDPPQENCHDNDPLCIFKRFLCFLPNVQKSCPKSCKKC